MIGARGDIWRQRLWVWVTALAFVALNGIGLLVYLFAYSDRVKTLDLELHDQGKRLADVRAARLHTEDLLRQARVNRERILQLYDEHFSTRRRRLTGVTAEVKELARRAGLVPRAITYPEEQIQQYGLIKRSFIFSVDGTYTDLRKFINLLELSDSFLTLEDASLAEEGQRRDGANRSGFSPPSSPSPSPSLSPSPPSAAPRPAPPVAAPVPSGALRMGLTISTLFSVQDRPRDVLAPLPGANSCPGTGANSGTGGNATAGDRAAGPGTRRPPAGRTPPP
jgi:Tfp pilus assembly protein PilO